MSDEKKEPAQGDLENALQQALTQVRPEFDVHMLNERGLDKARGIALAFSMCLNTVEIFCGPEGREMAIVRTKLQEAAFFAKRAMAVRKENQK